MKYRITIAESAFQCEVYLNRLKEDEELEPFYKIAEFYGLTPMENGRAQANFFVREYGKIIESVFKEPVEN